MYEWLTPDDSCLAIDELSAVAISELSSVLVDSYDVPLNRLFIKDNLVKEKKEVDDE